MTFEKLLIRIGAVVVGMFVGVSIGMIILITFRVVEHLTKIFDLLP